MQEILALKLDANWVVLSACNTSARVVAVQTPILALAVPFSNADVRTLLVTNPAVHLKMKITSSVQRARENREALQVRSRRRQIFFLTAHWCPGRESPQARPVMRDEIRLGGYLFREWISAMESSRTSGEHELFGALCHHS